MIDLILLHTTATPVEWWQAVLMLFGTVFSIAIIMLVIAWIVIRLDKD